MAVGESGGASGPEGSDPAWRAHGVVDDSAVPGQASGNGFYLPGETSVP